MTPHAALSYDTRCTDWDFLLPLEVADEFLTVKPLPCLPPHPPEGRPIICGFIALVKIFLSVYDLITDVFLSSNRNYPTTLDTAREGLPSQLSESPGNTRQPWVNRSFDILFQLMRRHQEFSNELPDELKLGFRHNSPDIRGDSPPGLSISNQDRTASRQFSIMRVNIHVTSLFFQSAFLDICLDSPRLVENSNCSFSMLANSLSPMEGRKPDERVKGSADVSTAQLMDLRLQFSQEILDILSSHPLDTVAANGESMVRHLYDIIKPMTQD